MIIECLNCNKKFNLDAKLIPENGRTLKCSACDHVWHYTINLDKNTNDQKITEQNTKLDIKVSKIVKKDDYKKEKINKEGISDKAIEDLDIEEKDKEVKDNNKDNNIVKLKMIFINFIILIISLLGLIILLDTFKHNLSNIFPGIVPLLDSFYETFLDLKLFFKDLAK